ncbi:MAG: ABC transporter substrate-binding protein [Myxococcota bacterium]
MIRRGNPRSSVYVRAGLFGSALLGLIAGLACPAADERPPTTAAAGSAGPPAPGPSASEAQVDAEQATPGAVIARAPRAQRIVSLSPIASRFLLALGVGDRLVAVDRESLAAPGMPERPATTFDEALRFAPDLVVVPSLPDDRRALEPLASAGARIVEFAPHDLEDVFALCRGLGGELVGGAAAAELERRIARPLALIAGQSPAEGRPRVLALVRVDPPEIAGGHSFETDLIEIAGGSSITHGSDDNRRPIDPAGLARLAPDLVFVMTAQPLGPADEDRALRLVGDLAPVIFFPFAPETFWLDEPARDAARLRESIVVFERAASDGAGAAAGVKPGADPAAGTPSSIEPR